MLMKLKQRKNKVTWDKKLTSTYIPGKHFMISGHQKVTLRKGWTWSTDNPTNSFPLLNAFSKWLTSAYFYVFKESFYL